MVRAARAPVHALLVAEGIAVLLRDSEGRKTFAFRLVCLTVAAALGIFPAFTRPEDNTPVLGMRPSVGGLAAYKTPFAEGLR